MQVNYDKIMEIYGGDAIVALNSSLDDVMQNINYLINLGFEDIEDIFERYPFIFVQETKNFQNKVNQLIANLGTDYINIIETNLDILEALDD